MRVYRWVLLTSLAGLTAILLGTAVYAWQTPLSPPITYNELYKQTKRQIPLRAAERGADYLAVVADEAEFMDALAPLLIYRGQEGLQVTAVSLAQIIAEFGDGETTPQAIRDFLAYTAENWQPTPRFILLVGDAAANAQANDPNQNLLPTYLLTAQDGSSAASDSWFTAFDDSETPMSIGRFPVQTASQLTAVVNKTIAYETAASQSPDAAWLHRALLIAGDAPYFDTTSDHLEDRLDRSGYVIHDLHMSQNRDIYADIVAVLNRGVGILNYSGYGGETSFGDGAAFTAEDARLLRNEYRLPIFTAFSCQNGAFTDPRQDSIAEQLLLAENGGVVAAIGAAGRIETQDSLSLSSAFYRHLLGGKVATLGEALRDTQTAVTGDEKLETAVNTYNLLGDPALRLYLPTQKQLVNPLPLAGPTAFVADP